MIHFVKTSNLLPGQRLALPVESPAGMVLLAQGVELTPYYIQRLESMGYYEVYVSDDEPVDVKTLELVSKETKVFLLKLARNVYMISQKPPNMGPLRFNEMELERGVARLLADLKRNHGKLLALADIKSVEDYIVYHAVNVCTIALLIGMDLKYTEDMLLDLGVGALLLDVGKMLLAGYLLEKKDRFTATEYEAMKEHTTRGFEFLSQHRSLKASIITLQHHERMDGSGYPRGLPGSQIHSYAKIVAIADVYDSLTSNTTFRKRLIPYKAVEYMRHEGQEQFDSLLLKHFLSHVALYPIGINVALSHGVDGVVTGYSEQATSRPIVSIREFDGRYTTIDLAEEKRLFIRGVVW